ncbi:MAG TPA: TIGR01777 family oxidoreductase [Bacteroidia bacterium]|nr:TIGR01777 family oxidoreductase [Bacteroidia bacterium]
MGVILISGGTGLVGKALSNLLLSKGHEVRILSRNPKSTNNIKSFYWDVEKNEIDEKAFDDVEHIVHLAGSGIADKRWTNARKQDIVDSRVNSIKFISSILKKKNIQLKSFVGASAIGIYGMTTSEKIFTETDKGHNDFLSQSCIQWENAYQEIQTLSNKNCTIRIGVVLSKDGGALKKLLPLFNIGLGSAVGSGKQYMPWIHIDDLVSVFHEALFNSNYNGIYNAVSSEESTNQSFSKQLAKSLSKPFFLPNVPAFILKIIFGEMANVLLEGSRVNNQKLINSGFQYKFPSLNEALKAIVSEK